MTTLTKMDKGVFIPFLDQFMLSPLVTWVKTFVPEELGMHLDLNELLDGVFLNEVMTQINPTATLQGVSKVNGDPNQRIKNLNILVQQIKSYYLDTLRQLVMTPLPNVLLLVKTPYCEKSLEEMEKMLLLLLGCAVQCEKKEEYIERIQALDFDVKASIAAHIQEVTHSQDNVLDLQWLEASELHPGELETMVRSMALHLRCLLDQRDTHLETIAELTQAREGEVTPLSTPPSTKSAVQCPSMQQQQVGSQQHLAVELADYKAKIRRLRQELEEKSEQVLDCRNDLDNMESELKRIQQENTQLLVEARAARAYRDELDSLRERAVRSDRLESEVGRYREKLHSMELYKAKVEELKEDNRVLQETKEVLEDQVSGWRARSDKLHQLVKHNLLLKARMDELEQEKEVDHRRIEELQEENLSLCLSQRRSMEESQLLGWELEQLSKDTESSQGQQSLSEEVSEKARSRLLRLEKENRRLLTTIEELRTSYVSYSPQHNQHCVCQSSFINTLNSTTGQISGVHNSPTDRTNALASGTATELMANGDLKCNQRPETEQLDGFEQEAFVLDQEKGQLKEEETEERLKEPASLHGAAGSHHHFPGSDSCWDCMVAGRPTRSCHASKHTERLETRCRELGTENQKLQASVDNTGRRLQRLEAEVEELEAENQGLQAAVEKLRISARRLEQLEAEKQSFEQERSDLERDKRRLEKENRRLRQQVDIQEASLDSSSLHMASLQRDTHTLSKELEGLREAAERLKVLERDNGELTKQAAIDQRTLVTLREELVSEKLRTQQRENELEMLAHELEMRALHQGRPQQAEQESAENSRFKRLESELELCLTRSLQIKEDKMAALEDRLQESSTLNQHLRQELKLVKLNYEALQQRTGEEETAASASTPKHGGTAASEWQRESQEVAKELLRVKDRIIELERNNATLEAERQALQVHQKQLEVQCGSQQAQVLALQRQTASLQETNTILQMHNANLQVERSTLSSQNASLLAQNGQLQQRQSSLESELASAACEREELRGVHGQLLRDHERLAALHERQSADYEALMGKHGCLKNVHRTLELEHRTLQDRYNGLLQQRSKLEVLETALKEEQEKTVVEKEQHRSAVAECRRLRDEKDWLNQTYQQLLQDNEELSADHKQLKNQSNTARLEHTHLEADFSKLKGQYQKLDITYAKLTNQCELLSQLKGNLEEENRHLLSQIQTLMLQNRTLLEQSMESKDMFHVEQRQYIDKLNELRRQKEKLEEKIMDQYKFYEPSPTRRRGNWIALKMKKLMKSRSRERGTEASLRPAAPVRSGSCEGLRGPPRWYCQVSGSVNGSGDAPLPAAAKPLSPAHRSTALRIFPRVRNRLTDRDKVKSLFRRSVSLCDLAFPAVLSDEDQWASGPEHPGLPEDTAEMLSSSLTFSMFSILHLHHTNPPQGDSPTDASLSAPGAAEPWVTDKDSNDNAVSPGIEDSELQHHKVNPDIQGESCGEFSVSLDDEPWSNGSSPVQQPPLRRTSSPLPAPGDASTPRHPPRRQSSASVKESAKSPPALPVDSMWNTELRAAANQKDPGPSQGVCPMRTTNSIRKGFGSQACRSSDTTGSLKLNRLLNGTAPKCDSAKADSACSPTCSPITVLYVQGKSPSVSGCLNCFSGPLGKERRLRSFRSPATLPRASSVISTAEGASRRSSVNSDCKVAASVDPVPARVPQETGDQNQQTRLSGNVKADAVLPVKPPRDPAMSGAAGSPKAPVQETLFGSLFTLSSVFSNTIFSDVLTGVGEGDDMNETSPCVDPPVTQNSSCPLEFPAQRLEEKQNGGHCEGLTEMDGEETKDRSS